MQTPLTPNQPEQSLTSPAESINTFSANAEAPSIQAQTPPAAAPNPNVALPPLSTKDISTAPPAPAQTPKEVEQLPAADADVIEKPWVERVEKDIKQSSDDPKKLKEEAKITAQKYLDKRFKIDAENPET